MKIRYNLIDKTVKRLSLAHPELKKAPVKIEKIVKRLGIQLLEKDFEYSMSGAAIVSAKKKIISINKNESPVRKRFTTAHELCHILLHYDQELTVDLKPIRLNRDFHSTTGESWREVEANYFAASILMPSDLVEKYHTAFVAEYDDDDDVLSALARKFEVSMQAMSIRLSKLDLFGY